ncbi:A24 family peptidase [Thermoactinomyces sp. CICC 10521]|uniref:prepilin peptidase n=1 Tax=Thermoactinomyces sp. CICC 10521 TaxID=2767426 RepID=UPI0018DE2961|nr:A24 family peptidase [Thermoactinomyces sp. CICC 10521]MBH8606792.1 prepilin peptidase [Thermoactinomyces sp. CICC 10521]
MFDWKIGAMLVVSALISIILPPLASWSIRRKREGGTLFRYSKTVWGLQAGFSLFFTWLVGIREGTSAEGWVSLVLMWLLILLSLTDLQAMVLPNLFTYSGTVLFAAVRIWVHPMPYGNYLCASALAYLCCLIISKCTGGMGMGDAKLLAMSGWVVGWPEIFLAFWLATWSALFCAVCHALLFKRRSWGDPLPFAPHLAIGVIIALLWGDGWIHFLLSFRILE